MSVSNITVNKIVSATLKSYTRYSTSLHDSLDDSLLGMDRKTMELSKMRKDLRN